MKSSVIEANSWIITDNTLPAYFFYKLLKGKVAIFSNGVQVNELEVAEGDDPVYVGIIAALRDDRLNTASVLTKTDVEVQRIAIDQVWGVLQNEIPNDVRENLMTMVEAISMKNKIDGLESTLASLPKVSAQNPGSLSQDSADIVKEINNLYSTLIG